jgi:uncharacterized Rossmann fold enzyme
MEVVLLAIALLGLAFLGMAFNIVVRKKAFPDTHVGHNKDMKKKGIVCAKTMDKMEQKKVKEEFKFKNIQYIQE